MTLQEAMESFIFPDNLYGMLIFCQMAKNDNIFEYSAPQNVQFLNWDGRQSTA